jgi:hypothetical protein
MSQIRFFFDEDVSHDVIRLLRNAEPQIDVLAVGDESAPAKHTADVEVYGFAVSARRLLVSADRSTMTGVVVNDLRSGGHNHGAIFLRSGFSQTSIAMDLHLTWFCEAGEDWTDRIDYLPY